MVLVIVDAGLGNIASVQNMVRHVGGSSVIRESPEGLPQDVQLILPGVGSFDEGVAGLRRTGWFPYLQSLPPETPLLGICLGMQLLGRASEEGSKTGLGRVQADFARFPVSDLPVPHIGWNIAHPTSEGEPLWDEALGELRYYFTHSYHAVCDDPIDVIATTRYGIDFPSAFRTGATYGVQFHPEKSHKFGMSLIRRWLDREC